MKVTPLAVPDVLLIEPTVFSDDRGFFFESFNRVNFQKHFSISPEFVQDNQSGSGKGVLRGLHYQFPMPQGKLIRAIIGQIFDVAVDIRPESPSYGQWVSQIITAENRKQLWIPEGFAHGFYVLSDWAEVAYKVTNFYYPENEDGIIWNDPELSIEWPLTDRPIMSEKDLAFPRFSRKVI